MHGSDNWVTAFVILMMYDLIVSKLALLSKIRSQESPPPPDRMTADRDESTELLHPIRTTTVRAAPPILQAPQSL